ncbi:MAG: CYTH domain-containing protein [bacterium]
MMRSAPHSMECEIKLTLATAEDYQHLREQLPNRVGELEQHNLFFDTPDRLLAAGHWTLRLRREVPESGDPTCLVTVKGPSSIIAGAVRRTEVEGPVDCALWERAQTRDLECRELAGPPMAFLARELDLRGPLRRILGFANRRTVFGLSLADAPRQLLLDRTVFEGGQVDHELELELDAPTSEDAVALLEIAAVTLTLRRLLEGLGVTAEPARSGKYSRALSYAARG